MSQTAPQVTAVSSSDRLSFTLFLAIALHGLLIYGVDFRLDPPGASSPSVTVTLATAESAEEPEEADFVAQANQIGSGTLDEAKEITTDKLSPFSDQLIQDTELLKKKRANRLKPRNNQVITTTSSHSAVSSQIKTIEPNKDSEGYDDQDIQSNFQEIASLTAKVKKQRQQYARRPRERVLTSISAKAARDAAYLNQWTRKVEAIGNQHFPEEAVNQNITGSLKLQSVIKWDGSLLKAKILKSSGHRILDDAAMQIIHRSSPFLPFPPEIRQDTDQLVIIRTWHFDIKGLTTTQ